MNFDITELVNKIKKKKTLKPLPDFFVRKNIAEYLIKHPEIWSKMGQAGRAFVEKNFDINKLNEKLMNIYSNLLEGKIS